MPKNYDGMAEWELLENIRELETTVEGLGQQNTDLELRIARLLDEIEQHKTRYRNAIRMVENRQTALNNERSAYARLAAIHLDTVDEIIQIAQDVRALKDVPDDGLEQACNLLANKLETALVP